MRRLFIDMDGVLADFDRGFMERFAVDHRAKDFPKKVMWDHVYSVEQFFWELPLMEGAERLMEKAYHIRNSGLVEDVMILTACPSSAYDTVADQKKRWIRHHFGGGFMVLPAYRSESKPAYIQNVGDILVDDWRLNCEAWEAVGGKAVKYENSEQTIKDLQEVVVYGRKITT